MVSLDYCTNWCKIASVISRNTRYWPTEKIPPPALLWLEAVGLSSMAEESTDHYGGRVSHNHGSDQGGHSGTRRAEDHLHLTKRGKLVEHRSLQTLSAQNMVYCEILRCSQASSMFLPPLFSLPQLAKKKPQVEPAEGSYIPRGRATHQGHFLHGNKAEEENLAIKLKPLSQLYLLNAFVK